MLCKLKEHSILVHDFILIFAFVLIQGVAHFVIGARKMGIKHN